MKKIFAVVLLLSGMAAAAINDSFDSAGSFSTNWTSSVVSGSGAEWTWASGGASLNTAGLSASSAAELLYNFTLDSDGVSNIRINVDVLDNSTQSFRKPYLEAQVRLNSGSWITVPLENGDEKYYMGDYADPTWVSLVFKTFVAGVNSGDLFGFRFVGGTGVSGSPGFDVNMDNLQLDFLASASLQNPSRDPVAVFFGDTPIVQVESVPLPRIK